MHIALSVTDLHIVTFLLAKPINLIGLFLIKCIEVRYSLLDYGLLMEMVKHCQQNFHALLVNGRNSQCKCLSPPKRAWL